MEDCGFHHSTLFPRFSSCSITEQHFPQWPFNEMVSGHRQKSCRKQGKEAQSHWHIGSSVVPPSPGCHHVHPLETQNHRDTLIVFISRKTHVSHWGIMCFFCIGALNILWWYIYIYIYVWNHQPILANRKHASLQLQKRLSSDEISLPTAPWALHCYTGQDGTGYAGQAAKSEPST